MPNRAEALAELIERVEAGEPPDIPTAAALLLAPPRTVSQAIYGAVDAVARLEAPLRERGWDSQCRSPYGMAPGWCARWWAPDENTPDVVVFAPTEARARLIAVLKALHWEETHHARYD